MRRYRHLIIALFTGSSVLAALIFLTIDRPISREVYFPGVMFGLLIVFSMTYGVPLGVGFASLTPMVTVAAYLVLGPLPAAWIVFLGACLHGFTRRLAQIERSSSNFNSLISQISLTGLNAGVHTLALLAADTAYRLADGNTPLVIIQPRDFFSLVMLGFVYLGFTYFLIGLYFAAVDPLKLSLFQESLPRLIIFESYPLVFAPLAALIYTQLGSLAFLLFAIAIVISSLITRSLAFAQQRLERRVKELGSLQAVGQAFSASLDLEDVLDAIYTQVSSLMPADTFVVALKNPQNERLSFPLIFASGERVSLELGPGEREYTEQLLNYPGGNLHPTEPAQELFVGEPATFLGSRSWLSFPLVAGEERLGLILTGSASAEGIYDQSHQEFLAIIASQATMAIQNARLYARTDETLARRVQELDSILNTVGEGVLLVDLSGQILTANPTLIEFLGLSSFECKDRFLNSRLEDDQHTILERIGYTRYTFLEDCQLLNNGLDAQVKARVRLVGPPQREVERTMTPVLDWNGENTGWLLVFRDLAEEREVERLRDEMMHMLVHDLRAPITTLQGSIELIQESLANSTDSNSVKMIGLAQKSSEKVLALIEGLLEIHQFEGGRMPLNLELIAIRPLLLDASLQLEPQVRVANIRYAVDLDEPLPRLYIDPSHFGRILDNLLDNAYKYTPDGGCIHFGASQHRLNDRVGVLIGVSDSGPGIPKQEQEQLFKKFKPVTKQLSRRPGTGLGLRYCKLAVEAQGGSIWVDSSINQGSTFYVWYPAAVPA